MKFKINQADFSKALIASSKSLLSKANLPILSNVLIGASGSKIEILSTDLETATKVEVSGKVDTEGKISILGKALLEFVSQLPQGEVIFEKLGEEVVISAAGYNGRFATMEASEFPAIPKIDKGQEINVDGADFARAVMRVGFSAAQDEARPILCGVLFEFAKNKISLVATDGYRLSFDEFGITKDQVVTPFKIVIPARAAVEVAKIVSDSIEGEEAVSVKVVVSSNLTQVNFKIANIEFTSRLIEGEFPNWQKTIPDSFTTIARLPKSEFIKVVRVASIFARDAGNIVKLKLETANSKASLSIFANAAQVGSGKGQVGVEMEGKGGEIAFNFRYLLEVLSVIPQEEVEFEMIESLNPGRIKGQSDRDKFFHIIMPVRLQG